MLSLQSSNQKNIRNKWTFAVNLIIYELAPQKKAECAAEFQNFRHRLSCRLHLMIRDYGDPYVSPYFPISTFPFDSIKNMIFPKSSTDIYSFISSAALKL
ncbi:hypothetical protein AX15_000829 [Amanita polypyramis BW_CC]|nr:hypothetical protein AX15_000829 [Amanita polypyramis BW_CC]